MLPHMAINEAWCSVFKVYAPATSLEFGATFARTWVISADGIFFSVQLSGFHVVLKYFSQHLI